MTLLVHQGPSPTPLKQNAPAFQQLTTNESGSKEVSNGYKRPTCPVVDSAAPMKVVISTTDLSVSTLSCLETTAS